ncbi:MAG: 5-methyltetrahydropteroyltriglutamate--homocysteine S-methyltransferase [Candidatus Spyradenecus sp.]
MKTSIVGYPRIGAKRELKFATEQYFKGEMTGAMLEEMAQGLRTSHWQQVAAAGVDFIPSGDFSFYDTFLDAAALFNCVPARYRALGLDAQGTYFAMARGYQGPAGDVHALAMKKWFNTNYHYLVPEIEDGTEIRLAGTKPLDHYAQAKALGLETRPVLPGPYTFLKLARFTGSKTAADFAEPLLAAYVELLAKFNAAGVQWLQLDEPCLVQDTSAEELACFQALYTKLLAQKGALKVLVQTYFGDVRDAYGTLCALPFDAIGLDFVEGRKTLELVTTQGFPKEKILVAGLVNGKNIWRANYAKILDALEAITPHAGEIILGTSCSLLHVPYTLANEPKLDPAEKAYLAFAVEKLGELGELKTILEAPAPREAPAYLANQALWGAVRPNSADPAVGARLAKLTEADFTRLPAFAERAAVQAKALGLPKYPTTTIGSFPQTAEVRANRAAFRKGAKSAADYDAFNKAETKRCIELQEQIGLDVLVHGEFERNDMVEFFGEHLSGFRFTSNGWVQSYGTRCVKPPVIWGDVSRQEPMTVEMSVYAQSLSTKPVKGMLTGPVTILNWSFPREDITIRQSTEQIALAIRDEVLDLEAHGIAIIQIDEAALREKLPLRKSDWHSAYLDWAIPAFRLVHSGVKPETQIHTHMCYSEFNDIIADIDAMDADVISFEASRADLTILDALAAANFRTAVGPGVYDIHSPRVPSEAEILGQLRKILQKVEPAKLWVNPDCGLKTRGWAETLPALENMVKAAQALRIEA